MNLKDNIEEQKAYLEKNLEQLNTVVSAILGYKTELKVIEKKQGNSTYLAVNDDRNIKDKCGAMAKAFKEVTIENFYMWWSEDGVCIDFSFFCDAYCLKFCTLNIINDMVTIV